MSLKIIAVGKIKRAELRALCDEYLKRLSRYGGAETEAGNMLGKLANFKGRIYALAEEGKTATSREFSKMIESDLLRGGSAFVIGGPYGLSDKIKEKADVLLSLSPMTFTHEFARTILLEQIYRAKTISANTGYHH